MQCYKESGDANELKHEGFTIWRHGLRAGKSLKNCTIQFLPSRRKPSKTYSTWEKLQCDLVGLHFLSILGE